MGSKKYLNATPKKARYDYDRMIAGQRIITNKILYDNLIDHCGDLPRMDELVSCYNRQRCGILDHNVAWIGNENKPKDLEFDGQIALGSV